MVAAAATTAVGVTAVVAVTAAVGFTAAVAVTAAVAAVAAVTVTAAVAAAVAGTEAAGTAAAVLEGVLHGWHSRLVNPLVLCPLFERLSERPFTCQSANVISDVFRACCVLHNQLLDHDKLSTTTKLFSCHSNRV